MRLVIAGKYDIQGSLFLSLFNASTSSCLYQPKKKKKNPSFFPSFKRSDRLILNIPPTRCLPYDLPFLILTFTSIDHLISFMSTSALPTWAHTAKRITKHLTSRCPQPTVFQIIENHYNFNLIEPLFVSILFAYLICIHDHVFGSMFKKFTRNHYQLKLLHLCHSLYLLLLHVMNLRET